MSRARAATSPPGSDRVDRGMGSVEATNEFVDRTFTEAWPATVPPRVPGSDVGSTSGEIPRSRHAAEGPSGPGPVAWVDPRPESDDAK